jgi:hypothetical protein
MVFSRAILFVLVPLILTSLPNPVSLRAQEVDRIWGRVHTVSGEIHEGFIRWDRNEGSWVDQLDGSKGLVPFQFQDWWKLAHPEDQQRDRIIELAGYRITWDDDEPVFPSSVESGIRFGHIRRLTVEGDTARLELRSGLVVELEGGATDLGGDLREILVKEPQGDVVELEWEDLEVVEFMAAPPAARAGDRRLHGTVELLEGPPFTGYISWDVDEVLTSDTLDGEDSEGRQREILFGRIAEIRPKGDGAEITLTDGEKVELSGSDDVDDGNDGIQISDPGLGLVDVDWDEIEKVGFHPPETPVGLDAFDGGRRLRGTVVTADSTELTGWIRWDGDEAYSWELLDGRDGDLSFDVEFGQIASIERHHGENNSINLGPTGMSVTHLVTQGAQITLRDGRVLQLDGSNDVDDTNHGIFVMEDEIGSSPDDEEAEWVMVKWEDFLVVRFEWGEGR